MSQEFLSTTEIVFDSCYCHFISKHVQSAVAEAQEKDWNGCEPLIVEELGCNASIPQDVLSNVVHYEG